MKKSMALFHIKNFSYHVTLLLKRKLQHVGHKWVICGSQVGHMWVTSGLFDGSVGQMGRQVQPTFNPDRHCINVAGTLFLYIVLM